MSKFSAALFSTLLLISCDQQTATQEAKDSVVVDRQQTQYGLHQPVPFFMYSQTRQSLIEIYKQTTSGVRTYTVLSSLGDGEPRFMCPSIGNPIPADTQLTNPVQIAWANKSWAGHLETGVIAQAEPNGTFTSQNTDGTWVLCVRKNGDIAALYTELKVTAFPFQVRWNPQTHMLEEVGGDPTTIKVNVKTMDPEKNASSSETSSSSQ